MNEQQNAIKELNTLIHKLEDSVDNYLHAAEMVKNEDLKYFFYLYARIRKEFIGELQNEVRVIGKEPEGGMDFQGKLHHAWVDLKSNFGPDDKDAILSECEKGEERAMSSYEDVLKKEIPQHIKDTLRKHLTEIQNNLKKIHQLKGQEIEK